MAMHLTIVWCVAARLSIEIADLRKMRYVVGLQPSWFQWLYNLSVIPHLFEKGYMWCVAARLSI
ncbi:MAG: hypothetical protein EAZ33_03020 [Oscillatoriales cyanobacterium]|nr:MAG: hypothetical protein EAZ33_03020 [Oscillatoriales cyanobacterium]